MNILWFHTLQFYLDKNELLTAKNFLEEAAESNLPEFLKALSDILVTTTNTPVARMAAGLQLKNHLTSKDEAVNMQYQQRWHHFPEITREYIKKNVSAMNPVTRNYKIINALCLYE